ncbi:unnamed protein product [Penicillium salamii]|nr:unnamed protein product [Penicillium salamii]CAG8391832.1 unnamed protein product [Penicillium salamii]
MDPNKFFPTPFPIPASVASPTNSMSPIDSESTPSISSLPSLTTSDSDSPTASTHTPNLKSPSTLEDTLNMEGNRNYLPRTMEELEKLGFAPVWSRVHGYPREIPEEISEYLDGNSHQWDEWIGPLSSLFWLAGIDELVEAISDPAIALQDEVRMIPTNVGVTWILEHLFLENKLPERLYNRYYHGFDGYPATEVRVMPVRLDHIPSQVGHQYARHRLCNLFPASRPHSLPQEVATVQIKGDKNKARLATKIEEHLPKSGDRKFLFRVCTRSALAAIMAFFTPIINANNLDNELGPGIYTSDCLEWVLRFGPRNCVLLVFRNPDFRNLNVWIPALLDWQHQIATWTRKSLSNVPDSIPAGWKSADIIQGAILKPDSPQNALPLPGTVAQTVATSPAGCAALAASLSLIVWIE